MNQMEMQELPIGRVIKRWITPQGRHLKMRIVKPNLYKFCDFCGQNVGQKAVKTEAGGGNTISTQCFQCADDEIKGGMNEQQS